jgi:phosphoribosylglycinamide formyltransferase 1
MLALADRIAKTDDICVQAVVAPNLDSPGAMAAVQKELLVRETPYQPKVTYSQRLAESLADCDWVCLAGYMRLFPNLALRQHQGRILNIHPALLPKFGGKGMYGMYVHQAVVDAGETETGCTVHFVTDAYDEGAIILQSKCSVTSTDSAEQIAARVLALEHETYFRALRQVIDASS